ncbi:tetratricopeptide repeat protein [Poritiphilus flavus]|uniref:Tetratricopeptide repeat protein n=1 Tax=Poritiphilus flavus TaxID=2697053 RepID=A0A6L9EF87_9FLAO|nr:tetratricopeptide repeat protein [Poritiphilus flavus]NAS13415.1 tetratricopeptide repeat protein [Poritiphilus flavus]
MKQFVTCLAFCCLLVLGCKESTKNTPQQADSRVDSIQAWVAKGRDNSIDVVIRRSLLLKAFDEVQNRPNDTVKTKLLSDVSLAFLRLNDSAQFRKSNQQALAVALQISDSTVLGTSYWDLASFYSRNSIIDSAYFNYAEAQRIFEAQGNEYFSGRMLYNMAVEQGRVKDYTGSEITTIRAIELLKPLNKKQQLYNCYNNLGLITTELKDYERAADYYGQALSYLDNSPGDRTKYLGTLNNLGLVFQQQGQHSKAISYFEEVLKDPELRAEKPQLYARTLDNLAYSRFKNGAVTRVKADLEEARQVRDSIADYIGLARSKYHLAEFGLAQEDTAAALAYALEAKEYALQSSNNKRLLETLQLLTRIDPENATAHTREYITLNDSLQQVERQMRNKFARIRFETDEFIAENELLARQRQMWIGIALGLFILAVLVFVIIRQRVRNQKLKFEQQQQQNNEEIFNLMLSQNQKIEEGKQSEQKRISEELHDGILGQMNGIRMVLLGLNKKTDDSAVSMRSQAIEKLQQVQEEIRTISHELNDSAYQKFHNFILSIEDLLKSIASPAGLNYTFDHNGDLEWDAIRGDIKINLYRIVQEGLQNCIKHAEATEVKLSFDADENHILVKLRDNGKGFDTKKGKKGIGHKNIRSRVEKLRGSWDVVSAIGAGTTVSVKVPYEIQASGQEMDPFEDAVLQEA